MLNEMKREQAKVALEIRKTPGVCGGRACVGNTRIAVWLLVALRKQGLEDEALLRSYPQLTPAHLRLVADYSQAHRAEVEHDIREQDEDEASLPHR